MIRAWKVLVGIILSQRRRRWPSITSALGQCIVLSGVSGAGIECVTHLTMQSDNTVQSPNAVSLSGLRRRLWDSIETALCLRKVYSRPSDGLVLGQRRRRSTGIEPAMGCDACPTLNRNLVGRPTSYVRATSRGTSIQVLNECWLATAMAVEGIHVKDIFFSLVLSLIIS